ncbi:MAG: hypothetical protein R2911_41400 [Caldilineaceae bacterium]
MNLIPLFVLAVLVIGALLLFITWIKEQRMYRYPALRRAFEPNSLLLIGLLLLAIVVLLVFLGLIFWN